VRSFEVVDPQDAVAAILHLGRLPAEVMADAGAAHSGEEAAGGLRVGTL
jgi:hypothetical protein